MTETLTKVNCNLKDCIYYEPNPDHFSMAFCKHPDILLHKTNRRCPLYRMNWAKKMEGLNQLVKQSNKNSGAAEPL
ncbi:hypothetical protein JW926_01190 [Candidatus Sumerlaeota bacterium]|nr:hypothetical protein [Candidatus Sumerlaeota bacterium]